MDWSESHNGVMLCSFDKTKELMPEVTPILEELEISGKLQMDIAQYLVDVKIHMLMPGQYPCIPNWHYDFRPRNCDGIRTPWVVPEDDPHMFMYVSGHPATEYRDKDGEVYTKPAGQWNIFTRNDLHRGAASEIHTWRCFIRVIPKSFVHDTTINVGTLRRHSQVYLDSDNFTW